MCGSDLKTFQSGNPRMMPPITMGHEFTGQVEAVGTGVRGFSEGERVVMATSVSCGQCYYCRRGWSNLCLDLKPMGFAFPGGMADYLIVPELAVRNGHVVKVPAGLASEHAALAEPVSCAVSCAELCGIGEGDTVVVVGAGPMGLMNLFVAREFGARKLILAQREGKRLEQARVFDCDRLVNTSKEDLRAAVLAETGGLGADCAIVAAPSASAQAEAPTLVRKRGTVCLFASLPVGCQHAFRGQPHHPLRGAARGRSERLHRPPGRAGPDHPGQARFPEAETCQPPARPAGHPPGLRADVVARLPAGHSHSLRAGEAARQRRTKGR